MPLIEVRNVTKIFRTYDRKEGVWGGIQNLFVRQYRDLAAVGGISFSIDEGEMVGYIGANGAGKSTTIKMLTGILVPTSGTIVSDGFVPFRDRSRYTHNIGVVFGQRTQLWWDIAVVESFRLLKRIYGISDRDYRERLEIFDPVLDLKPLLHKPVRKLSLGQRMRCDLAAALLHNPRILFLDEPTIGLDVVAKENIRQFLHRINRDLKVTVLLTTHDLSDIEELCRRIMIIDKGKLLFDGELAALKKRLAHTSQIFFELKDPQRLNFDDLGVDSGVEFEQLDEMRCRLVFDKKSISSAELIKRIVNSLSIRDLVLEDASIEEMVREIYRRGLVER
ncbi:MAG: ATP-binding cassette domain-containing protein [Acidobacteria bacterium]|nr:ATP-binding cassette domain-containing protein [Acidobacteriota bacterium]